MHSKEDIKSNSDFHKALEDISTAMEALSTYASTEIWETKTKKEEEEEESANRDMWENKMYKMTCYR